MSYKKLKKKQVVKLVIEKDNEIEQLKEQISLLQIEKETLEQLPPQIVKVEIIKEIVKEPEEVIEMTDEDKMMFEFLENQVKNTIYKQMKSVYQDQLNRIVNKYN